MEGVHVSAQVPLSKVLNLAEWLPSSWHKDARIADVIAESNVDISQTSSSDRQTAELSLHFHQFLIQLPAEAFITVNKCNLHVARNVIQ